MSKAQLALFPAELRKYFDPTRLLGAGAMGMVFMARETRSQKLVAVKTMQPCGSEDDARRLEREAEALLKLRHPNVLRVFGHGNTSSGPYLVAELLRGFSLDRAPPLENPLAVMLQVARGLEAVHGQGILHRDVKPSNVFLTNRGRAVLMDFGLVFDAQLSRLTQTGGVIGSIPFMAPELAQGEPATRASDWYSWGATLYFLVEGRPPFAPHEIMLVASSGKRPDPRFEKAGPDSPVRRLIERVLTVDAASRPASLAAVEAVFSG